MDRIGRAPVAWNLFEARDDGGVAVVERLVSSRCLLDCALWTQSVSDEVSASTKGRIGGALLLGSGILLLKIGFFDVLAKAHASSGPITTYVKAVVAAPLLIAVGLLALVIGVPREPKPGSLVLHFVTGHGPESRLKPLGYVIVLVLIGIGLGLHSWLNGELRSLGYDDR